MILFDIGANKGDVVSVALEQGFDKVIALEPAPRMYPHLAMNFLNDTRVVPLKFAVTDKMNEQIEFYECEFGTSDGSSTTEIEWLTDPKSRVAGLGYRTVTVNSCTIDWLIETYGLPELVKIDVEGGEHKILQSLSYKPGKIAFEWHIEYMDEYIVDLKKLAKENGYTEYAVQYITHHLLEPTEYRPIKNLDPISWINETKDGWANGGWEVAGAYTPKTDVGMIWVK